MASSDKKQVAEDKAEFADAYNAADVVPVEQTEDEAFGLGPEAAAVEGEAAVAEGAPGEEVAAGTEAAPVDAGKDEQRLRSWEGRLKAKEQELAEKEAALSTSNVGETQTEPGYVESEHEMPAHEAAEGDADGDPAKALAEDFGEDFVALITKLVMGICSKQIGDGVGSVSQIVDELIAELGDERKQNHFDQISSAHADFMELTDKPEFSEWLASLSPEEQASAQSIMETGKASKIIELLTKFKASQVSGDSGDGSDEDEWGAAEGIRSSGMKLPVAPGTKDDFAAAWNEA